MIKINRIFGLTIITGTDHELTSVRALSGTELKDGDKLVKLPYKHHVHRNPGYPAIIAWIERKEYRAAEILLSDENKKSLLKSARDMLGSPFNKISGGDNG